MNSVFPFGVVSLMVLTLGCVPRVPGTGNPISGKVLDSRSQPIELVTVTIKPQASGNGKSISCVKQTEKDGTFSCPNMDGVPFQSKKAYTVTFQRSGFNDVERPLTYSTRQEELTQQLEEDVQVQDDAPVSVPPSANKGHRPNTGQ